MLRLINKNYIGFYAILVGLCAVTCYSAIINDACKGIDALRLPPSSQQHVTKPDALVGVDISTAFDLSWISSSGCSAGSQTFSHTADWTNSGNLCLSEIDGLKPTSCSGGKTRGVVSASISADDNSLSVNAKLEFQFTAKISGVSYPIEGYIGFDVKDIPSTLIGSVVPLWTGSYSGSASGKTIIDYDMFDGVSGKIYAGSISGTASADTIATVQGIAAASTSIAGRMKSFELIPSALEGDLSARMAFPDPKTLMNLKADDVKMVGNTAISHASAICEGEEECGKAMVRALVKFAESEGVCGKATVNKIHGSSSAIVALNVPDKKHSVVSTRASVQGSVKCSNGGDIVVTLEALSSSAEADNVYDTQMLLDDKRVAVGMAKAVPMSVTGSRVGAVGSNNGAVNVTMEGDLFGYGRGGMFVEDVVLDENAKTLFVEAVEYFIFEARTEVVSLDLSFYNHIMEINPEEVFDYYYSHTATPTGFGLWQYWARQVDGIEIVYDPEKSRSGLVANIDLTFRNAPITFAAEDTVFVKMNYVLERIYNLSVSEDLKTNVTVPVMNFTTNYRKLIMDGAISTRIAIPKLTQGLRLRSLASSDFFALATVSATFPSNSSITEAELTYEVGRKDPVVESATMHSLIGGGYRFHRSASGAIVKDESWTTDKLHTIAAGIGEQVDEVQSLLQSSAEQLSYVCESTGVKYHEVVDAVQKALANQNSAIGTLSLLNLARSKVHDVIDKTNDSPLVAYLDMIPNVDSGSLQFVLTTYSIHHFTSEASCSDFNLTIPIPRLAVQTPGIAELSFRATINGVNSSSLTITGSSSASGWSLPVRNGMRNGVVSGNASVTLDFPDSCLFTVDLIGKMNRGDTVHARFEGNMAVHVDDDSSLNPSDYYSWSFSEDNRGDYAQVVKPEEVLNSLLDNIVLISNTAKLRMATPVPPFADPIGEYFDLSDIWKNESAYFYTDEAFPTLATVMLTFPVAAFAEDYNFTFNDKKWIWCEFNVPQLTASNAESEFLKALKKCNLDRYVTVTYNEEDEESGSIVFQPSSPGLLYSFKIDVNSSSTTAPLKKQTWNAGATSPDFLSWDDFYDIAYTFMLSDTGIEYTPPEFVTISTDDLDIVDANRTEFYPNQFPAIFFPISVPVNLTIDAMPIKSYIESENYNVQFNISDYTLPATIVGEMNSTFGYVFWSSLGDGTLNISSSYCELEQSFDKVKVPASPKNTFSITFKYETRSKSNVDAIPELHVVQQEVALTPGRLSGEELLRLPELIIDQKIKKMISIGTVVDELREPVLTQVSLLFSPLKSEDGDKLDIPISVSIDWSNIPFWGNDDNIQISETLTACAVNKNFTVRFNVTAASDDSNVAQLTGTAGVIPANATAVMETSQEFEASSARPYEFQANLVAAVVDENVFDKFINSTLDSSVVQEITDFVFAVDSIYNSKITQGVLQFANYLSQVPFDKIADAIGDAKYYVETQGDELEDYILDMIASLDRSHICKGISIALDALESFTLDDYNQVSLPMVNTKFVDVIQDRITNLLKSVNNTVCSEDAITIVKMCDTLTRVLGVPACGEIAIEDGGLAMFIDIKPPKFNLDSAFNFDLSKLIPGAGAGFSAGFGSDGDFSLEAEASASFGIRIDFDFDEWDVNVTIDPKHTGFNAAVALDAKAALRASLGSVVLNFASASVSMNAHVTGSIKDDDIDIDYDGSAALTADVSAEPILSCTISTEITSLTGFIKGDEDPVFDYKCSGGLPFLEAIELVQDSMSFSHFFEQDPSLFWKQFSKYLDVIIEQLIEKLLNRAVGFIGKQLQGVVRKALSGLTGPDVADSIGQEIAQMVANLILNDTGPSDEDLQRIALMMFTGILNKQFGRFMGGYQLPMPEQDGSKFKWAFRLGSKTTKPLTNIDFHLGGHGPVQFGIKCSPDIQLQWEVNFDLIWSAADGVDIEWPVDPAFGASATILSNGKCTLEGRLLFFGAYMEADITMGLDMRLKNNEEQNKLEFQCTGSLSVKGETSLGFVGVFSDMLKSSPESLAALPHVKTNILFEWSIDFGGDDKDTPTKFEMNDVRLCLGTFITKFVKSILDKIYQFVNPLMPVFGKAGILLKKIKDLKDFLGDKNDLLGILELICKFFGNSCGVDQVRKVCECMVKINDIMTKLNDFRVSLGGDNADGCAGFDAVYGAFTADWSIPDPKPLKLPNKNFMNDPDFTFPKDSPVPKNKQAEMKSTVTGWKKGGKFDFNFEILQNFPAKLISLLMGKNVALFSFTFPSASFGITISWAIPVFPAPYVEILIEAKAGIEFRPPPIALMSNAIMDTIRTKNPSHIFRNLALRSLEDNGKPFYFIKGFVQLQGGVSVGLKFLVFKVSADATLSLRFDAGIALVSVDGEPWTTFDQLVMQFRTRGVLGAIRIDAAFNIGFNIAIKGCVKVWKWKKCKTFAEWGFSYCVWSWSSAPSKMGSIADPNGFVNADSCNDMAPGSSSSMLPSRELRDMSLVGYNRFTITPTNIMILSKYQSDADAPRQRTLSSNPTVRFGSSICDNKFAVSVVGDIKFPIQLPACDDAILNVSQSNYESAGSKFTLTSNSVRAGSRPAMTFSNTWGKAILSDPAYGGKYEVSGKPGFPVFIETGEYSSLDLKGSPSAYGANPLEVTGSLDQATANVLCTDYHINGDHFTCTSRANAGTVDVKTPAKMRRFTATATLKVDTVFNIEAVPKDRTVRLVGGPKLTNFSSPDLGAVNGYTECVGNSAGRMYLLSTIKNRAGAPASVKLALSTSELDNGDGIPHVLHHANIPYRIYDIHGAESQTTETFVNPTSEFDVITLKMHSKSKSNMTHVISGCHARSGVDISLDGDDNSEQTVVFGSAQGLKSSSCSPVIRAKNRKINSRILVNADKDDRRLRWMFRPGKFVASSLNSSANAFQVQYEGISHVTVNFPPHYSDVVVDTLDGDTDFVFNFPHLRNSARNRLTILGSPSSVFVNGPVELIKVGYDADETSHKSPFEAVKGLVAVTHPAKIILDSSKSKQGLGQNYTINSHCLTDRRSTSSNWKSTISSWMIEQMRAAGVTLPNDNEDCNLLYNRNVDQKIEITTGNGRNEVIAEEVTVPVDIKLGSNSDRLVVKNAKAKVNVDMGEGPDSLDVELSSSDITVNLGEDKSSDFVNILYTGSSPSIDGDTFYSIDNPNAKVRLNNWKEHDHISILRSGSSSAARDVNVKRDDDVATLNITKVSNMILYEQESNKIYKVIGCARNSGVSFDSHSAATGAVAKNTNIIVTLPDPSVPCTVIVNDEIESDGTATVLVPEDVHKSPTTMRMEKSGEDGMFTYGSIVMQLIKVSHFEVNIPDVLSDGQKGAIELYDFPACSDVLIKSAVPDWSVNIWSLNNQIVVLDATTVIGPNVLKAEMPVVVAGNSGKSVVKVDGASVSEVNFVSGCFETEHGKKSYSLSDWMLSHASALGVTLDKHHTCIFDTVNTAAINISHCSTVNVALIPEVTPKVFVTDVDKLGLTLNPILRGTTPSLLYGLYSEVNASGYSEGTKFTAKNIDDQVFSVDVVNVNDASFQFGYNELVPNATINIDYIKGKSHALVNLSKPYTDDILVQSNITVTNDKLVAFVNGMICTNRSLTPKVVVGHNLTTEVNMAVVPFGVTTVDTPVASPILRSLTIVSNNSTNRTNYWLSEVNPDNTTIPIVDAEWDTLFSGDLVHNLRDSSKYALRFDIDPLPSTIRMKVTGGSSMTFSDLQGSTVMFVSASSSNFTPGSESFYVNNANYSHSYCFDPCDDCTDDVWRRAQVTERICRPRLLQGLCKERAKVEINFTGTLDRVACSLDLESNDTCPFAINSVDHTQKQLVIYDSLQGVTTAMICFSILLTLACTTSVTAFVKVKFFTPENKTKKGEAEKWWYRNPFRDFMTNQFSWFAVVVAACMSEATDVELTKWGSSVVSLLLHAKAFVLNWYVGCTESGDPVWMTAAVVTLWSVTVVALALTILLGMCKNLRETPVAFFSAVFTIAGFILTPLAAYSSAFLNISSYEGFATGACIILLCICFPYDKDFILLSFILNVLLPVAMCVLVGVGTTFLPLIIMSISGCVLLTAFNIIFLCVTFYRNGEVGSLAWKHSVGWTISTKIFSTLCGLCFLILLFYDLTDELSKLAVAMWFLWVIIPFLSVVPVTFGVPAILREAEKHPLEMAAVYQSAHKFVRNAESADAKRLAEEAVSVRNKSSLGSLFRKPAGSSKEVELSTLSDASSGSADQEEDDALLTVDNDDADENDLEIMYVMNVKK